MTVLFRGILLALLATLMTACASDPMIVDSAWTPRQITGHIRQVDPGIYGPKRTTIVFRNGAEIQSDIVDIAFIGQLAARENPPFVIYSGRRCYDCESNPSIYVHSPTGGKLSKKSTRYRYPGRLYSHVNGSLVEETRMFFGDCMPGRSAATAVWFVRTRRDTIDWQDLVIVVEVLGSTLHEETLSEPAPSVDSTLTLVDLERCREIPGRRMSSEP